jgi:uncharacterized protein with ACT and thioredoxin-like domain
VKILVANTPMDTDKIKIYGARVRVDSMTKVGEIEAAEKQKMANKVGAVHLLSSVITHSSKAPGLATQPLNLYDVINWFKSLLF